MNMTTEMSELHVLTLVPEHLRDSQWEESFLRSLPDDFLRVKQATAENGPDSWPYLFCETDPKANEPALKIIEWLSDKGIGLAINPRKEAPDFVLSYGMIWNFRERGEFITQTGPTSYENKIVLEKGTGIIAGDASADYFPPYARAIVRQFFLDQNVMVPKFLLIGKDNVHFDLCFSLESLKAPPEAEHKGILEALSWFFPSHYSLALVSEEGLPKFLAV
jgi:hypothetical protein